ncbi:MAG: EAL domain-containing protein [Spirochaetota bacterium]
MKQVIDFFTKYKYTIIFPLTFAFLSLLINVSFIYWNMGYDWKFARKQILRKIISDLRLVQSCYKQEKPNTKITQQLLQTIRKDKNVIAIKLIDSLKMTEQVLKKYRILFPVKYLETGKRRMFLGKSYYAFNKEENAILAIYPLSQDTPAKLHTLAVLYIYTVEDLQQQRSAHAREHFIFLLLTNLGLLTCGLLAFFLLYRKRIRHLIRTTEEFGKGNFNNQITIVGNDEIASLSDSFNKMAKKIKHMAYYDHLTGILNRFSFEKEVDKHIAMHPEQEFSIIYLDLDGFKDINDTLGHSVGDKVLLEVTIRIKTVLPPNSTFARSGGDKFSILVPSITEKEEIALYCKSLLAEISLDYYIEKSFIHISGSIGIVCYPKDGKVFETLLKNAESAMYEGKKNKKNSFTYFNENISLELQKRVSVLNCLHKALRQNEFHIVYQPVVSAQNNYRTQKLEALLRWNNTAFPGLSPAYFIPLLEESKLILKIGRWIIMEVCMQIHKWRELGIENPHVNINVSIQQLTDDTFLEGLQKSIRITQISPQNISLEITESEIMKEPGRVIDLLRQIQQLGIKIAIDDFGTGYSSLSYLKHMPIDYLKIDKAFITGISKNSNDTEIVKTILTLAKSLHLQTVAEGVENKETVDYLSSLDCELLQGFYFSKPISADEVEEWFKRERIAGQDNRQL